MTEIQKPKFMEKMSGTARWQWFDKQKALMAKAVSQGITVSIKPDSLQGFLYMMQIESLRYCELITMHHNAVVTMACAAIEEDIDSMNDWLLEALDQADCSEWQMYESAQEFYNRNSLPWPESQQEHRENLKANKKIAQEDSEKFQIWYEQNVAPQLEKAND